MTDRIESLKHTWFGSGVSLALALSHEAREAARLKVEAGDLEGAFALATDSKNQFLGLPWGNATPDALAARILDHAIRQGKDFDAAESDVIEALLLALVRYVGPLQFSVLLSRLMPSKD